MFKQENGNQVCASLYFGGGTPSSFSLQQIEVLVCAIKENFTVPEECEFSFEMHPNHVEKNYLQGLCNLGVTRISIGVQSFTDNTLTILGRQYTAEEAKNKVSLARQHWQKELALDLMYGIQGQSTSSVENDLQTFLLCSPDHISCYSLSIDNQSAFHRKEEYERLADEDVVIEQYLFLHKVLKKNGFEHYEIANWAKEKHYCKHNLNIWQGNSYVGFGLSAQSFWQNVHRTGQTTLQAYLENPSNSSSVLPITNKQEAWESHLLGATRQKWGIPLEKFPVEILPVVEELCKEGLLERCENSIIPTIQGWLVNNEVVRMLAG